MSSDDPKFDMHVHSRYSKDGLLDPVQIIRLCKNKGLDGVAITDHDTIRGGLETKKIARDVQVIVGAEIKTDQGEVIGYHLSEEIKSRRIEEVIDEIKRQGGYVSVPHPFDSIRKSTIKRETLEELKNKFDYIEGMNARSFWFNNKRAQKFAEANGIPVIGGSDAHTLPEVGGCYTVFEDVEKMKVKNVKNNASILHPAYYLARTKFYKTFGI